jgi:hypothetical protein
MGIDAELAINQHDPNADFGGWSLTTTNAATD